MEDPIFLDFPVVEDIHQASLALYGGISGIREKSLIESALGAARNTFYMAMATSSTLRPLTLFTSHKHKRFSTATSVLAPERHFSFFVPTEYASCRPTRPSTTP